MTTASTYTLIGLFDGAKTHLTDCAPTTEEHAIRNAIYCAEDWDRVDVLLGDVVIGHAKVPGHRNGGAVWYQEVAS